MTHDGGNLITQESKGPVQSGPHLNSERPRSIRIIIKAEQVLKKTTLEYPYGGRGENRIR